MEVWVSRIMVAMRTEAEQLGKLRNIWETLGYDPGVPARFARFAGFVGNTPSRARGSISRKSGRSGRSRHNALKST